MDKKKSKAIPINTLSKKAVTTTLTSLILMTGIGLNQASAQTLVESGVAKVPAQGEVAKANYEFVPTFNNALTKVETFGSGWVQSQDVSGWRADEIDLAEGSLRNKLLGIIPKDDQKGKIGVKYTNIGIYEGRQLDLKITINDWDSYAKNKGYIWFNKETVAEYTQYYNSVNQTWQFLDHETQKPVVVDGFMTVNDIDGAQAMIIDKETAKHIDKVYVPTNDTKVSYKSENGNMEFYSERGAGENGGNIITDFDDHASQFTMLYSGVSELTFDWAKDFTGAKFDVEKDKPYEYLRSPGEFFGYTSIKPLPTELLKPTKLVSDTDEKSKASTTLKDMYENLSYVITHTVPQETQEYYYPSYSMTDTLNNALATPNASDVKIENELGEDVTARFDTKVEGQKVTATAKPDFVSAKDFYGHTYKFIIDTKVKPDADTSTLFKDGTFIIPNSASVSVGDKRNDTGTVTSKFVPKKSTIDKGILSGDTVSETNDIERNTNYTYRVTTNVTNNPMTKTVVLKDDLGDELDLVSATVKDATGKDITATGTLTIDKDKELVTWQPKDVKSVIGKTLNLDIVAKVKPTANLTAYKQADGTFKIPNTAELIEDGNPLKSKTVNTVVPFKPTTLNKTVVDKEGNEGDLAQYKADTDYAYNVHATIGDVAKSVVITDDLVDELDVKGAKVLDKDGKDITSQGKLEIDDEKEIVKWTANEPTKLFGQKLTLNIKASVKKGADLKAYVQEDGSFKIPNTANIVVDEQPPIDSEKVDVIVPKDPTQTTVTKSVLTDDNEAVKTRNIELNKEYTYHVSGTVTDNPDLESFEIKDDMEDVLTPTNVKVVSSDGQDVTDAGKLDIKEDGSIITWKPNDVKSVIGKELTMVVQTQVKPNADLSEYLKDGKFIIPNTAEFIVDGEPTKSDKVDVVAPEIKASASKKILDNGKLLDLKEVKKGEKVQYVLKYNVPNGQKLSNLKITDDLEDVTDLDGAKVFVGDLETEEQTSNIDDLTEITKDGTLNIDKEKELFEWSTKDASQYAGKTITVVVDGTLKKDADLTSYKDGNIPNTGKMEYVKINADGKEDVQKLDTNTVNINNKEKPTVDEPTAEEPTTEKPTTEKPTTEKPTTEKPTTEEPTTEKPTTEQPTTEQPTTEKPTVEQSTTEQPTTEKPTTEKQPPQKEKPDATTTETTGNQAQPETTPAEQTVQEQSVPEQVAETVLPQTGDSPMTKVVKVFGLLTALSGIGILTYMGIKRRQS